MREAEMGLLQQMAAEGHEQVAFWSEPEVGYRGIIAVHDTTLGPSMGGTRFWNYPSESEALRDVLLLSRAMTYKSALAGLEIGGGKSVILRDPRVTDRAALFRAHGRAIESLGGRYYAAEDVGTTVGDMDTIRGETRYVAGLASGSGDPSILTALGCFQGLRAAAMERWGSPSLRGRRVAVQGVGSVGLHLCAHLAEEGADLILADLDPERARRAAKGFGGSVVPPEEIVGVEADILAPCALGGVIDDRSLLDLRVEIVAGAANNQLAEDRFAEALQARGILYAPDFAVNAGGIISVCGELKGWDPSESRRRAEGIHDTLRALFERARAEGITPLAAARRIAEDRIAAARKEGG